MNIKKITFFLLVLTVFYIIYRINKPTCKSCGSEQMFLTGACPPVRNSYTTVYRRLNCFCDNIENWKKICAVIHHLDYYKNLGGEKYPENMFGTKKIPCGDDELQVEVFDDNDVFLYISTYW